MVQTRLGGRETSPLERERQADRFRGVSEDGCSQNGGVSFGIKGREIEEKLRKHSDLCVRYLR